MCSSDLEAAFALGELGAMVVLTASSWHLLRTDDRTWIDSGDRDTLFPEVAGEEVLAAAAIPAW